MGRTTPTETDKTVCFAFANGCPRSLVNMSLLVEYFKANGWGITTSLRDASLIVFACCAFDVYNEETSFEFLAIAMNKKREDARIVVFGCLPGINKERLLSEFAVAAAVPPYAIGSFDELIGAKVHISEISEPNVLAGYEEQFAKCFSAFDRAMVKSKLLKKHRTKIIDHAFRAKDSGRLVPNVHNMYEIKIAKGCMGACSYCAIKNAVGPLRSKPSDKVMAEFQSGLDKGHRIVRYIAEDVGAYGQDIKTDIAELLKRTFEDGYDFKLAWDDFSPGWLIRYFPELLDIIEKNHERIAYLGFPMQSGSDDVLKMMDRGYKAGEAARCMKEMRKAAPGLRLTTHVLIGFPGETDSDFRATLDFLSDLNFEHVQAYKYSDRPNTASANFPDKVPEKVKSERVREFKKRFPAAYI